MCFLNKFMKYYRLLFLISALFLLVFLPAHTASAQDIMGRDDYVDYGEDDWDLEIEEETPIISDPRESLNRAIFAFNAVVYKCTLTPASQGYDFLLPQKVQGSINNLFSNLAMPIRFFNNIFQGKRKGASTEMNRFLINSTLGLGGLFDPAESVFKLELRAEDFGQTLGYYGLGSGNYIVWPIVGPSNGRDSIGFIVDLVFSPLTWLSVLHTEPDELFTAMSAVRYLNNYSYNLRERYEGVIEQAIDPYAAIRHAYTHNRQKKIEE